MIFRYLLFLGCLIIPISIISAQSERPAHITEHIWEQIEPHLLPDDHPIKTKLDQIFSVPGTNDDPKTFYKAGFRFNAPSSINHVVVATHPELKGYVLKLYLDNQPLSNELPLLLNRIKGANIIRDTIEEKKYTSYFKVPNKWVYSMPNKQDNPKGHTFLLIAEDMRILCYSDNKASWKNQVTYEQVYMVWDIMETCGLFDSVYIDNVPFCKDRTIAFIDTEHSLRWPVPYFRFNKRLSGGKRELWKKLTGQD